MVLNVTNANSNVTTSVTKEAIPQPKMKTVGADSKPLSFNDWTKYISKMNDK